MSNYFTDENALKHQFFIVGFTSDCFFTDGGLKLDKNGIEKLVHLELKQSGYERIVFYDKDIRLYCYDDKSYELRDARGGRGQQKKITASTTNNKRPERQNRGLRIGPYIHITSDSTLRSESKQESLETSLGDSENSRKQWGVGEKSGVQLRTCVKPQLHFGKMNLDTVKSYIRTYMKDATIKTAVVVNDPDNWNGTAQFSDLRHEFTTVYERMGVDNKNIIVFLYPDISNGNFYTTDRGKKLLADFPENERTGRINIIEIPCPNAAELRNMLMYFKVNFGLKIRAGELSAISLALKQAMGMKNMRINSLYCKLKNYADKKEIMNVDACYTMLGEKKPESAQEQLDHLIGMEDVKKTLSQYDVNNSKVSIFDYITASRLQPDKEVPQKKEEMIHFVLTGNPGTGKTTVAKLIGQLFYEMGYLDSGHVVETDRSQLVAGYVGQTAILTRQKVMEAMGGVLFIDEAYTLKREGQSGNDFGQEAIDTLCKLMDQYKGRFIVVAAGYPKEMEVFMKSNPGLQRRFTELHIDDYTPEEMLEILKFHASKEKVRFSKDLESKLPDFCENWVNLSGENWGNAGEAVKLIESMVRNWKNDKGKETATDEHGIEYSVLKTEYIPDELKDNLKPVADMRTEALNSLNRITGLHGVKATIEKLRRRMIAGDMLEPGHYMFVGNPGTGKTTVARYMGKILRNLGMLKRGHLVEYTATGLISAVSKTKNSDFSEIANKALNGVLFIDEAYQLTTTPAGLNILDSLLPFMEENRKILCVILAGYRDEMDNIFKTNPGFKGRFTEVIDFANYSGSELCEILLKMLEEKGITPDDSYREYALRALTRYVAKSGNSKDFENARYLREKFIPQSLDAQNNRLMKKYGEEDFPREQKKILTGDDIPEEMRKFTKTPLPTKKQTETSAIDDINKLIGFREIKDELQKLLDLKEAAQNGNEDLLNDLNFHWVLRGNPGTGKTTVAKLIGKVYKEMELLSSGHTVKVTRKDLVAEYVGHTAPKTQQCIDRAMGGVLFIDEAYTLKREEQSGNDFGQEAIDALLEQMSEKNGDFAVIAAGYPDEMEVFVNSNPGFCSRFAQDFTLSDYSADELLQIFILKCKEKQFYLDEDFKSIIRQMFKNMISAKRKGWANGREAENLERSMRPLWAKKQVNCIDSTSGETHRCYTIDHIPESYRKYLPEVDNVKLEDGKNILPQEEKSGNEEIRVDMCEK